MMPGMTGSLAVFKKPKIKGTDIIFFLLPNCCAYLLCTRAIAILKFAQLGILPNEWLTIFPENICAARYSQQLSA